MFLLTTKRRHERILEELPRMYRLEAVIIDESPRELRRAYLRTFHGITVVFPFPLRPSHDPVELSSQLAFVLSRENIITVSLYPRPDWVVKISKSPLILGDLLISPSQLRKMLKNLLRYIKWI